MVTTVLLPRADTRSRDRRLVVEKIAAMVSVFVAFLHINFPVAHLDLSVVFAAVLAPVWMSSLSAYVGARLLVVTTLLTVLAGAWLSLATVGRDFAVGPALDSILGVLGLVASIGVVLWARTLLPAPWIAVTIGFAMLVTLPVGSNLFAENPWKFGFSAPVTVIVLGLAWQLGSRWVDFASVSALALVSAVTDSRSNFGMLALAAALVLWQIQLRGPTTSSRSWIPSIAVFAAFGYAIFEGAQSLILGGYLGEATQVRSEAQIEASGSLLLGGRPELAATASLMQHHIGGFGVGVVPSTSDIMTAKSAMASINYDPNNGYVERFMFGTHFELHSVVGDMWANFGIMGLILVVMLLVAGLRGVALSLRQKAASGLVLYLVIRMCWGVAFSPFGSAATLVAVLLGLVIPLRSPRNGSSSLAAQQAEHRSPVGGG